MVKRWCLQLVGVIADVLLQRHQTRTLRGKRLRTWRRGRFGDGRRNTISQWGAGPMPGQHGRSLEHPISGPRQRDCKYSFHNAHIQNNATYLAERNWPLVLG